MLASFEDGTKTMVEMTSIGNSTGFIPEVRGAHGPKCSVADLPKVFVPKSAGGIFESKGFVDYAVGRHRVCLSSFLPINQRLHGI